MPPCRTPSSPEVHHARGAGSAQEKSVARIQDGLRGFRSMGSPCSPLPMISRRSLRRPGNPRVGHFSAQVAPARAARRSTSGRRREGPQFQFERRIRRRARKAKHLPRVRTHLGHAFASVVASRGNDESPARQDDPRRRNRTGVLAVAVRLRAEPKRADPGDPARGSPFGFSARKRDAHLRRGSSDARVARSGKCREPNHEGTCPWLAPVCVLSGWREAGTRPPYRGVADGPPLRVDRRDLDRPELTQRDAHRIRLLVLLTHWVADLITLGPSRTFQGGGPSCAFCRASSVPVA